MSYLYKFVLVLIAIAMAYTLFGIGHFKWMYHNVNNPAAAFQVSGNAGSDITFIEFLNYGCGHCKTVYPVIKELQETRKDIRYLTRPIAFDMVNESGETVIDKATRIALAAGLQGKFNEFNDAFLEYPEATVPDDFIQEIAELYNVDYDQLVKDSEGKKVEKYINENFKALEHAGLYSVPTFMIGHQIYIVTDDNLPDLKKLLNMIANNK